MRHDPSRLASVLPGFLLLLAGAMACSRREPLDRCPPCPPVASSLTVVPSGTPPTEPAPAEGAPAPVDPGLVAFLSRARAAHHAADQYEEQQDLAQAVALLENVIDGPKPGVPYAAEVREVLADTHARLADLQSQRGAFDAAERHLAAGLELVEQVNYFRGHLFEVRGLVQERLAKQLRSAGQLPDARNAEAEALEAFEKAMEIQAEVIERTTEETGRP